MLGYQCIKVCIMLFFMCECRLKEVDGNEIVTERLLKIVLKKWIRFVHERFAAPGDLNFKTAFTYMNTFAARWRVKVAEEERPCRCYLCDLCDLCYLCYLCYLFVICVICLLFVLCYLCYLCYLCDLCDLCDLFVICVICVICLLFVLFVLFVLLCYLCDL